MKKQSIKVSKNLSLDKETIARLNDEQLGDVAGGSVASASCNTKIATEEDDLAGNTCGACSCNGTPPPAAS
jgi:hypothetical protein